jgi:hypothetical protein
MPPIRTVKITPEERRIADAIRAVKNEERASLLKAHAQFSVPYGKLRARFHGRPSTDYLGGHNKTLDQEQEEAVLQYIDRCDELGAQCSHKQIELAANSVLRKSGSPETVSRAWTSCFIKRHKVNRSYIQ